MSDDDLSKLKEMRGNLTANKRNPEFLFNIGSVYFNLGFYSAIDYSNSFGPDQDRTISMILDWHCVQAAAQYSVESYKLASTAKSALLFLNALYLGFNYPLMIEFITSEKLLEKYPTEKYSFIRALVHAYKKNGKTMMALQTLFDTAPEIFKKAQESFGQT